MKKIDENKVEVCHCHEDKAEVEVCHCHEDKGEVEVCHCHEYKVGKPANDTHCHCHEEIAATTPDTQCHCDEGEECICHECSCSACEGEGDSCSTSNEHGASCGCGAKGRPKGKVAKWVLMGVSLVSLVLSFINPFHNIPVLMYFDFGLAAVVICGYPLLLGAIDGFKNKKLTSSALMSLSIIACVVLQILVYSKVLAGDNHSHSYIFAAAEVAFLMAVGQMLEDFTIKKARSGLTKLFSLVPDNANLIVGDATQEGITSAAAAFNPTQNATNNITQNATQNITTSATNYVTRNVKTSQLKVGDIILVKPSEKIGADGVIVEGESAVDESIITGEATPKDVGISDNVFGGTFNTFGLIKVRVTKPSREMAVEKLKKLVIEAEGKKAPISRVADRWASWIIPAALISCVLVFLFNFFFFNKGNISQSIFSAVTALVVFCPCALALSTPTAIAAGLGALSGKGILVKSGGAIETLAKAKTIAFDKTGTITDSRLSVLDLHSDCMPTSLLGAFAAATESQNNHPIAKAITERFKSDMVGMQISNVKAEVSVGVFATVNGKKVAVKKWKNDRVNSSDYMQYSDRVNALLAEGKTVVAVEIEDKLSGIISLGAKEKDGVRETISALKNMGVSSVMLTGDNANAARFTANNVGIDESFGELLPEDKVEKINQLKQRGKVCMVGDGVNDAPSLATADCSIAMGALGSDLAIETADIALVQDDISKVGGLVKYSKRVFKTIVANMIAALSIALIALVLTFFNLLNPVSGALVHNLSTLLVVFNSALLLKTNIFNGRINPSFVNNSLDKK